MRRPLHQAGVEQPADDPGHRGRPDPLLLGQHGRGEGAVAVEQAEDRVLRVGDVGVGLLGPQATDDPHQ